MIVAAETQDTTTRALAVLAGHEVEIIVYAITTYSNPNTWGMVINDLNTGEQALASFPRDEDWAAPSFYNLTLWGEGGRLGHPRSLEDLVATGFSDAYRRPAKAGRTR